MTLRLAALLVITSSLVVGCGDTGGAGGTGGLRADGAPPEQGPLRHHGGEPRLLRHPDVLPLGTTPSEMSDDEQQRAGIRPGLLRLSIGYTGSVEQRWAQLRDALEIMNLVPLS